MRSTPPLLLVGCLLALAAAPATAQDIGWLSDWRKARDIAQSQNRLVLLHFYSNSCGPCQWLEHNVFNRSDVGRAITGAYVPVKIDVDQAPDLAKFYKVDKVPTDVLVGPDGKVLQRRTGAQQADQYIAMLDATKAKFYSGTASAEVAQSAKPSASADSDSQTGRGTQNRSEQPHRSFTGMDRQRADNPNDSNSSFQPPWQRDSLADLSPQSHQGQGQSGSDTRTEPLQNNPPQRADVQPAYANPYENSSHARRHQTNQYLQPDEKEEDKKVGQRRPADHTHNSESSSALGQHQGLGQPQDRSANPHPQLPYNSPTDTTPGATGDNRWTGGGTPQQSAGDRFSSGHSTAQTGPQAPSQENDWGQSNSASQPPSAAANPAEEPPVTPSQPQPGPSHAGLEGYCPVTLVEDNQWTSGDPRWGVVHRGRTYLFTSQQNQQKFFTNPDRYSPALSGYDPVRYADTGQLVDGKRDHGVYFGNQYYLFANEAALKQFQNDPQRYIAVVQQAMNQRANQAR